MIFFKNTEKDTTVSTGYLKPLKTQLAEQQSKLKPLQSLLREVQGSDL